MVRKAKTSCDQNHMHLYQSNALLDISLVSTCHSFPVIITHILLLGGFCSVISNIIPDQGKSLMSH